MLKQILSISKVKQLHHCAYILAKLADPERFCGTGSHFGVFIAIQSKSEVCNKFLPEHSVVEPLTLAARLASI